MTNTNVNSQRQQDSCAVSFLCFLFGLIMSFLCVDGRKDYSTFIHRNEKWAGENTAESVYRGAQGFSARR